MLPDRPFRVALAMAAETASVSAALPMRTNACWPKGAFVSRPPGRRHDRSHSTIERPLRRGHHRRRLCRFLERLAAAAFRPRCPGPDRRAQHPVQAQGRRGDRRGLILFPAPCARSLRPSIMRSSAETRPALLVHRWTGPESQRDVGGRLLGTAALAGLSAQPPRPRRTFAEPAANQGAEVRRGARIEHIEQGWPSSFLI